MPPPDHALFTALYSGTPDDKLAAALALYQHRAHLLTADPGLEATLARLRLAIDQLDRHMSDMELGALCSQCAAHPGGGCCSTVMADNTDALQILINLLLGVAVRQQEDDQHSCCFLGPRGCCFPAKPIFCLNYNCSHILTGTGPEPLSLLYQRVAAVLSLQTGIETRLLDGLTSLAKSGVRIIPYYK